MKKLTMNDLKPFNHGEEGTHSVCNKHNIGGKSICCKCSGKDDCEDKPMKSKQEQKKSWEDTFDKEFCITESIVGFPWDKFKNGTLPSEVKQFIKDLLASNKNKILKLLVEGK